MKIPIPSPPYENAEQDKVWRAAFDAGTAGRNIPASLSNQIEARSGYKSGIQYRETKIYWAEQGAKLDPSDEIAIMRDRVEDVCQMLLCNGQPVTVKAVAVSLGYAETNPLKKGVWAPAAHVVINEFKEKAEAYHSTETRYAKQLRKFQSVAEDLANRGQSVTAKKVLVCMGYNPQSLSSLAWRSEAKEILKEVAS